MGIGVLRVAHSCVDAQTWRDESGEIGEGEAKWQNDGVRKREEVCLKTRELN